MVTSNGTERPAWFREWAAKYGAEIATAFILHFNTADYVQVRVDEDEKALSLRNFLSAAFGKRDVIAIYNRAEGITFPYQCASAMRERFIGEMGLGAKLDETEKALWEARNPGKKPEEAALPTSPRECLQLLEQLLKRTESTVDVNEETGQGQPLKSVVIVEGAELVVPNADIAAMSPDDRTVLAILQRWGRDEEIADAGNPVILITQNLTDIHESLRAASSRYEAIAIPIPTEEERLSFVEYLLAKTDSRTGEKWAPVGILGEISPAQLARMTAGLNRLHVEDLFLRALEEGGVLTEEMVKDRKYAIISSEFDEVIEVMEPKFGFEALGGLEQVKGFFRRNVIGPLKTGNRRRVPQGVLLVGPPGTGKSFCAQAVAKESGLNCINLNLAKILGQYVGNSLAADEEVILFSLDSGLAQRMTIAEAFSQQPLAALPTVDDAGHATIKAVTGYFRHSRRPTLLEFKTRTGRHIRVTHEHSLFIQSNARLVEARGDAIKVGDRIAVACGWNASSSPLMVDLNQLVGEDADGWMVTDARDILTRADILKCAGVGANGRTNPKGYYYLQTGRVPLKSARNVASTERLQSVSLSRRSGNFSHPVSWQLTPAVAFFAGSWMANGSHSNGTLRITCHEQDADVICAEMTGIPISRHADPKERAVDLFLEDWALAHILQLLGACGKSSTKRIPAWAFGAPPEIAAAFLRGYFSGDGSCNGHVIEATTVSHAMAGDLLNLLARFGIIASLYSKEPSVGSKGKFTAYRVSISRSIYMRRFQASIGFVQPRKNEALQAHFARTGYEWRPKETGNVYWDEVMSIEEVEYDGYVYDIEVQDTHRFISGYGGVLTHNSERNMEKALRAIQGLAPVIVFIDELDQAFQRGSSGDSGVSSRLFSRLLQFMADTGNRGRVVWLAASNRPDMIDAALKRPGRFDKIVAFLVPNEAERGQIILANLKRSSIPFSIVADDPRWEGLLQRTDNWTGAELEGLVVKAWEIAEDGGRETVGVGDLVDAVDRLRPSTADIEWMTELALREVNDRDLLPAAYSNRLDNRKQIEEKIRELAPRGKRGREI